MTNVQVRGTANPTGSNSLTSSATVPAATQTGDQILAVLTNTGTHPSGTTPPTGYTYRGDTDQAAHTANLSQWLYTKTAVSGDAGATVTTSANGAATRQTLAIIVLYDADGGTLSWEDFAVASTGTIPSKNSVAALAVGLGGAAVRNTGVETWTESAGWTEQIESLTDNGSGGKSAVIASKLTAVSSGTNLGGGTFTPSAGTAGASWVAIYAVTPPATGNTTNFLSHL